MSGHTNRTAKGAPSGAPAARVGLRVHQPVQVWGNWATVLKVHPAAVDVSFLDTGHVLRVRLGDVVRPAGLRQQRRARSTGTLVGIYEAGPAGLDPDGGPWLTVCETHGTLANHLTLADARGHAPAPEGWCEACRQQLGES